MWITLVMQQVSAHMGVPATRSGGTANPSVAYFLSRFLARKGVKLGEREINRIYGDRHKLIEAIEGSMPSKFPSMDLAITGITELQALPGRWRAILESNQAPLPVADR
jgi:hypothetical protein